MTFDDEHIETALPYNYNSSDCLFEADDPIPSVENAISIPSSREVSPILSSSTTGWDTPRSHLSVDTVSEQTNALQNLSLSSPCSPNRRSESKSPNPSFQVHPSTPTRDDSHATEQATEGMKGLSLHSPQYTPASCMAGSPRSPSPFSPRPYEVESEEPPSKPFHDSEFQEALSLARSCISKMGEDLSSSNLEPEIGSTIHSLREQAVKLSRQQLPSSCVLGMIGDSAAGKSSLINSLLDKPNLARAVSKLPST
jgi:hypothetical protein